MATIDKAGACVVLAGVLLLSGSAHAKTAVQKCQEAKLKAQGKLELCLKKNAAKVIGGKPDASSACQTKFSAALTKAGTACHYLDNGDGTVSDLNTGLVWEKKDNLDGSTNPSDPHDADNLYAWSSSGTAPDGSAFTAFLFGLNGGTSPDGVAINGCFVGRCDWRLPTIEELAGIVDETQGTCSGGSGPCIDPTLGFMQADGYWSATTFSRNTKRAWLVDFSGGDAAEGGKDIGFFVRAVRGGL